MALSKVISFLSGHDKSEAPQQKPMAIAIAVDPPEPINRLRNAMRETAPAESLMGQLRDIIVGPQTRLSEARFEELLDILDEQKCAATMRFEQVEKHLGETVENTTQITTLLEGQDAEIGQLKLRIDTQVQDLREEQRQALREMRVGLDLNMEALAESLKSRMQQIEITLRSEVLDLTGTVVLHIDDEDRRWEAERGHSLAALEKRIAQWRAELDDGRRNDMQTVANSMMDIGRRLLALQVS